MEKIKVSLVGCGRISTNHINALLSLSSQYKIVDVCDLDAAKVKLAISRIGADINGYCNFNDLLNKSESELIVLATPSGLHSEQAIASLKSGRHVLTEKPMATNMADALLMSKQAILSNKLLFVVKQNRLNPTVELLKKIIDQKKLGKIYTAAFNVFWTRPQSYYDQASWRGTWKDDGGAIMNQASHYIDLISWLLGEVVEICSFSGTLARRIEAEDTSVAIIKLKSGGLVTLNVTMLSYDKNMEGSITILGECGTIKLGGIALNKIEHWNFLDKELKDLDISNFDYQIDNVYGNGHQRYYENVSSVIRGNAMPVCSLEESLQTMKLICGIYESAREKIIKKYE